MLLIRTDWGSFEEYLSSLSKPARKNYKTAIKRNHDLRYEQVPFDREEVERYMQLWEHQLVRGKTIQWGFPIGHVEDLAARKELCVFRGGTLALHFIQKRSGFWECHPPMYDKKDSGRYLAKWMWFSLIRYAIENKMVPLDLGGGIDDWREHIKHRFEYPNPAYKWMYVPERAKQDPDSEPAYYIKRPECQLLLKN